MFATQGKVGIDVVIKGLLLPAIDAMTAFTFFAVKPKVLVVIGVATDAAHAGWGFIDRLGVARIAIDFFVLPLQFEFRVFIVIKREFFPFFFFMAFIAFASIDAIVHIIDGMARHTGLWNVFKFLIGVAGSTGGLLVFALQGEIGFAVVEVVFLPLFGGVAVFTFFAESAFVGVMFFVAIKARLRRLAVLFTGQVTAAARCGFVLTFQFVVSL